MPFDSTEPEKPIDGTSNPLQPVTPLAILIAARECVARPGAWYQGLMNGPNGSHCVVGWLGKITRNRVDLIEFTGQHLAPGLPWWWPTKQYKNGASAVVAFNDKFGRKQKQIVRMFDRAIKRATA